jgi:hypothetical protein
MVKNELDYQQMIIDAVREAGGGGYKIEFKQRAGCPDLLLCMPEKDTLLVETKMAGNALSPLQQHTAKLLAKNGFNLQVISINGDRFNPTFAIITYIEHNMQLQSKSVPLNELVGVLWRN